ncbi:hypothetical protein DL546_002397 [Coniochaeta pulveracea]|uniref:Uncharacterized protein n=1 Tax=Coniochaeta pulveracea TaxID=177199 RepID=A0A420Y1T0_9PEZI|nr:hypothetical protein DL546_002397 [Coniochaeta pulveracea]
MDSAFTDAEKRFLLAEMIKVSHIDIGTLVNFARDHELAYAPAWPGWLEMELPRGRNMKQCYQAADAMFNMHLHASNVPSLKRKSADILDEQVPKRPNTLPSMDTSYYSQASRSFGPPGGSHTQVLQPLSLIRASPPQSHNQSQTQPVTIQPRPPSNNVAPFAAISSPPISTTMLPAKPMRASRGSARGRPSTGRKRGRPSKAEKEEWARQNALRTQPTVYAPIVPAPAGTQPSSSTYQHISTNATPGPPAVGGSAPCRALSNESLPESASQSQEPSPEHDALRRAHSAPRTLLPPPITNQPTHQVEEGQRYEHSAWRDYAPRQDDSATNPRETRISQGYAMVNQPEQTLYITQKGMEKALTAATEPADSRGLPALTNQA